MRRLISESPPVTVFCDDGPVVHNIGWFEIGGGIARLNREKLQRRPRTARLETIHTDIATLTILGFPVAEMPPMLGQKYRDLDLRAGQLQAAFSYPGKAFPRRLFQRGLVEIAQRPEALDLTAYDKQYLSYHLDGKPTKEIIKLLGVNAHQRQQHYDELVERTGWENESQMALAGLMSGQIRIWSHRSYPCYPPPATEGVPEDLLSQSVESLPPERSAPPPTNEQVRHQYMDDPGLI